MNRNVWAAAVISLMALCWATAFLGAGAQGLVYSVEGLQNRLNQIEPELRSEVLAEYVSISAATDGELM